MSQRYNHPELTAYKNGMETVYNDADEFFRSLGYEHIRHTGKYKITTLIPVDQFTGSTHWEIFAVFDKKMEIFPY